MAQRIIIGGVGKYIKISSGRGLGGQQRGRGVYAARRFKKGSLIEVCPLILIKRSERKNAHRTILQDYMFLWGKRKPCGAAVALGFGSFYNHSYGPNARYYRDYKRQTIYFKAIKDIAKHDEILINYNCQPHDQTPVWFDRRRKKRKNPGLKRKPR